MKGKLIAGAAALCLAAGGTGVAMAAKHHGPPPKHQTITAVQKVQFKINRYVKDGLRWNKDTYQVQSGGTLKIVNKAHDGPHTFTVVKKSDLPRTTKEINQCQICEQLGQAHGADPESDAPPAHFFLDDGQPTADNNTPPNVDKPGDSAFVGPDPGSSVTLPVTAKKGTTLHFMCLIHPWMQGKVIVQ